MTNGQPVSSEKKKGLSPLAWVAIGCGAIVVLGFVVLLAGGAFLWKKGSEMAGDFKENPARAAAEMIVRVNPDLETVDSDENQITVRNTKTGEVATFNHEDIQEGKFSFTGTDGKKVSYDFQAGAEGEGIVKVETQEGTTTIGGGKVDDIPQWAAIYPDSDERGVTMMMRQEGQITGSFWLTSSDPIDDVAGFYSETMDALGLQTQKNDITGPDGRMVILSGHGDERTLSATITEQDSMTRAVVQFSGPEG